MDKEVLNLTCKQTQSNGCCCYCPLNKSAALCSHAQRTEGTFFEVIENVKEMNKEVEALENEEDK